MIKQKIARLGKSLSKRYRRIARSIGASLYGRMRPTCIVIGTQKGGTTALHKYLSQHPDIVSAIKKELHFFNCDIAYNQGDDFYETFFEANTPSRKNKMALDVTPDYLFFSYKTAERIAKYSPDIKLIALLRNPITRAYSAWQMYKRFYQKNPGWHYNWNCACGLDNALQNLVPRKQFGESFLEDIEFEIDLINKGQLPEMSVLSYGFYADQLAPFYRYFKPEQLLIIQSESMRSNTVSYLHQIESHLNIAHHAWSSQEVQPYFEGGYGKSISSQERHILKQFYQPHNEKLFSLLNKEFDWA